MSEYNYYTKKLPSGTLDTTIEYIRDSLLKKNVCIIEVDGLGFNLLNLGDVMELQKMVGKLRPLADSLRKQDSELEISDNRILAGLVSGAYAPHAH